MKTRYQIIEDEVLLHGHRQASYGIAVYVDAEENGAYTLLTAIHDVSSDGARLWDLVQSCNRLELSALHLNDVVEDFLAQY